MSNCEDPRSSKRQVQIWANKKRKQKGCSFILIVLELFYINFEMSCRVTTCSDGCCNQNGDCPSNYSPWSSTYFRNCYIYYSDDNSMTYIIAGVAGGIALILLIVLICCCYHKWLKKKLGKSLKKVFKSKNDVGNTILMRGPKLESDQAEEKSGNVIVPDAIQVRKK